MATDTYKHKTATRRNAPTPETEPMMSEAERQPKKFFIDRRKINEPVLAWDRNGETSAQVSDKRAGRYAMEALPLYVREKIAPAEFVRQLRKQGTHRQLAIDDFNGLPEGADPLNFYEHSGHWQNRLIHGNSIDVMKSLIAKDGLAGQVQMIYYDPPYGMSYGSNFQPTTGTLDGKDNHSALPVDDGLPIKAFRDTYHNGVHSYFDEIHRQCVLAQEMLHTSGSIFIQIGDDNVHSVAAIMDETFGSHNRVSTIPFMKSSGAASRLLPSVADYLLWYAKDIEHVKFNQLYVPMTRPEVIEFMSWHVMVELPDGSTRSLTENEKHDPDNHLSDDSRLFKRTSLDSQGVSRTGRSEPYEWRGRLYQCSKNRHWSIDHAGLDKLDRLNRLIVSPNGSTLNWKRYEDEIPGNRVHNLWHQQMYARDRRYVVQTSDKVIERCLLMTTEPGDLVVDPTCGSGTTAEVAESWGRRWITIDVQRVAVSTARSHLLTRCFPWHITQNDGCDPIDGFLVETIPHVSPATLVHGVLSQPENQIRLVDQTTIDGKRARICSAFTVESLSPYNYLSLDDLEDSRTLPVAAAQDAEALLDILRHTPVCDGGGRPVFDVVETTAWPEARLVSHGARCVAEGRDDEFSAAVMIAAGDATVTAQAVRQAALEARDNDSRCRALIVIGFDFEGSIPQAVKDLQIHKVLGAQELRLADTKKGGRDGGSFTLIGEPEIELTEADNGQLIVELLGADTYDPATNRTQTYSTSDIECWMIDTDHDSFSFKMRHCYFPNGIRHKGNWNKLLKSLKKDADPDAENNIVATVSQPFVPPREGNNIAVKIITKTGAEMGCVASASAAAAIA